MEYSKKMELVDRIIAITSQGPVSGWIDRIGEIAMSTQLPLEFIKWNESPRAVAMAIIDCCDEAAKKEKKLEKLNEVVTLLEREVNGAGLKEIGPEEPNRILDGSFFVGTDKNGRPQTYCFFDNRELAQAYIDGAYAGPNPDGGRRYKQGSALAGSCAVHIYNLDQLPHNPVLQ